MEKKKKGSNFLGYAVGSIALCAVTAIIIPLALPKLSGRINKIMIKWKNAAHDKDSWGPVVEKKHTKKEETDED